MFGKKPPDLSSDRMRVENGQGRPLSQREFKEIYEKHVGLVRYVLRTFRFREAEESELVQDVFLKLYESWERIDPQKLQSLLAVMTRNMAIDFHRKREREKTDLVEGDSLPAEPLWHQNPRRFAEMAVASRFIEEVSQTKDGACFGMFYRDELSISEISERLGESPGSISTRMSRLRQKFRERIQAEIEQIDV